jgi:8-oxo-dGTP pyrophosphatase MutT (NUDIX family)
MAQDICVPVGDGYVNVRVGAIIQKDGKLLMVGNDDVDYCYSVGGRIQFGESAEEALRRELREETGCELEIERLGFIHEDFFWGDCGKTKDKLIYELGFYYYVKTPEDFAPHCESLTAEGRGERLEWVSPDTKKTVYPAFFRTELNQPCSGVRHIVTDERE